MVKTIITKNSRETRALGEEMAKGIKDGPAIFCLEGNLGSGKTTFTQGLLKGLGAEGPYTSPTFVIMKEYKIQVKSQKSKVKRVYHLDAYRVGEKDVLNLGWEELISDPENAVIVEWPERIKNIIPTSVKWLKFKWLEENEREIVTS